MGEEDHYPPTKYNDNNYKTTTENILKICTYNVRSLATFEKYIELTYTLKNINFDIIGLAEVRRSGCNIEEYQDYVLCYKGKTQGLHGVGFLVKKEHKNKITKFTGISERVALLQIEFDKFAISLIQAYAPTEKANEEEIRQFYEDLHQAHSLADGRVLVVGDFNAKIGQQHKSDNSQILGPYRYGERNKRGERLIEYASEYNLAIMNTFFKKKGNRKWTWLSPDKKTSNEIDFVLTNTPKMVTNVEVINNLKFPSDHRLVRTTLIARQPKATRKSFKHKTSNPKSSEEIDCYLKNLTDHLESLDDLNKMNNLQTYYNQIENLILDSLNTRKATEIKTHKIFSKETELLIKRRSELINTKRKSTEMKSEFSRLFKTTNKSIKKDYENYRQNVITKNLEQFRSTKRAYKELTTHKKWIHNFNHESKETKTRKDVIRHATNFYKNLYMKKDESITEMQTNYEIKTNTVQQIDEREVYMHIKQLKNEKSPGPDGISNEAIKTGAPVLLYHLTQLFNMILNTETVPKRWCSSDIILLFKKGNPQDIGNYRPISLLSSTYKLFASIILKRITQDIDNAQPLEQAGFRSGFSTIDHIQTIEQILEKYREFNRPLYVAFIDYCKAFDSISHNSIWNALYSLEIDQKYINIIKYMYNNSTSKVRLETSGEPFKIERGVRQGDPLSPKLFIAVLQDIFSKINWTQKGILLNGKYLNHLRFADDIAILAETPKDLEEMIRALDHESKKVGLEMNTNKTKIMTNSFKRPIRANGHEIEYVDSYIYLGKRVSFNAESNLEEITRRISLAWKKFWSLKEILKGNYSLQMKKIVMDTCIMPCLLYGCQTWVFTKNIKQKIANTQKAMERSILMIRKSHKIRSEVIRKKTMITDALRHALALKWKWAGHIARYTDRRWTIESTKWKGPSGKRNIGRPKQRWADDIVQTVGRNWMEQGRDRERWKRLEEAYTHDGVHNQN